MTNSEPHAGPVRLEAAEAQRLYAMVKALPYQSPSFSCTLAGCPTVTQTKHGLERHFMSIHMPKGETIPTNNSVLKQTRSAVRAPSAGPSATAAPIEPPVKPKRKDTRRNRIRTHRVRPSRSKKKKAAALLEQLALAESMESLPTLASSEVSQERRNDSVDAGQPLLARHDHGADDENKPREERSYLEFFPFLSSSLRLEIVDANKASEELAKEKAETSSTSSQDHQSKIIAITGELASMMSVPTKESLDGATSPSSAAVPELTSSEESTHLTEAEEQSTAMEGVSEEVQREVQGEAQANPQDHGQDHDEDMDAGGISDPDVFFDAKGFPDSEADAGLNQSIPNGAAMETEGSLTNEILKTVNDMEMDMDVDAISPKDSANEPSQGQLSDSTALTASFQTEDQEGIQKGSTKTLKLRDRGTNTITPAAVITAPPASVNSHTTLEPKTPMALLPKSSFRYIPREDDDLEEYHLPIGHNVRYIEPTETELAERVEYDMDEQDEFWLKEINAQRRKEDLGEVSASVFEKTFDRLEKEWFDLTKNIPKPTENLPPEDSACNICDDGECENSNAIVFCDGCNLAVHQDCYGIPYIPEGQWLCRKCMLSPQMPVSCIFCPSEGGAFKQTTNSRWAHLLCASWIPEVGVANTVYMEPIDNVEKIPSSRWKLHCYICKIKMGACIQCDTKSCFRAFHVTCARKAHLSMKSKLSKVPNSATEVLLYKAHCHKHSPRDYKTIIDIAGAAALVADKNVKKKRAKIRIRDDDSDDTDYARSDEDDDITSSNKESKSTTSLAASQSLGGSRTSKAALAHQKHYTPGAPLAPQFIVNRLLPFVSKLSAKTPALRKTSTLSFLHCACKYWSLKRESRRGAPLLKRLHLEPWTASASAHRQTEEEKLKKLQTLMLLRGDLEKVRMLAELVRKRERAKLKRQELQNRYLSKIIFPLKTILEDALAELEKLDRQKYFAYPISADEVKDYHDVIKNPICFQTMTEKLDRHEYRTVEEFSDDARRIYQNCLTYNKVDTPYYRAASRQCKHAEPFLLKAKREFESLEIDPRTGFLAEPIDPEIFTYNLVPFQHPSSPPSHQGEEDKAGMHDSTGTGSGQSKAGGGESAAAGSPRSKKRDASMAELPMVPFTPARSLRATKARTTSNASSQSLMGTSVMSTTTPIGALSAGKALQDAMSTPTAAVASAIANTRRSAAAASAAATSGTPLAPSATTTSASSRPSRHSSGFRPEVPKLKTATVTRADVAKAKINGAGLGDGQEMPVVLPMLDGDDDLLEKLKNKSKKSRSLAVSLQSRLKPSIVDKVKVINKPAPKGWAYVVVEGDEEDTTEGEGEGEEEDEEDGEEDEEEDEEEVEEKEKKKKKDDGKEKEKEKEGGRVTKGKAK